MGTLIAIYIRARPALESEIVARFPGAFGELGSSFFAVELAVEDANYPAAALELLSKQMQTEVLWLVFQSAVDTFEYRHWIAGECLRKLVHGRSVERTWEVAEGQPETWEEKCFFDERTLADLVSSAETPNEREEVTRIFRNRLIEPGSWLPMVDARETARAVAEHFPLPGWNLDIHEISE